MILILRQLLDVVEVPTGSHTMDSAVNRTGPFLHPGLVAQTSFHMADVFAFKIRDCLALALSLFSFRNRESPLRYVLLHLSPSVEATYSHQSSPSVSGLPLSHVE